MSWVKIVAALPSIAVGLLPVVLASGCNPSGLTSSNDGGITPVADGGVESSAWRWESPLPQGNSLTSVWGSSDDDVWAVGVHGAILHITSAGAEVVASPSGVTPLAAVWGSADDDVWAAGASGTLLHWDGQAWAARPSGTTSSLSHLWGTGANDVYAVGDQGTILHFDGTTWSSIASGSTEPLTTVVGLGGDDVWVGGGSPCVECGARAGVLLHGSAGAGFVTVSPAPPSPVSDLWPVAPGNVWAATQGGVTNFDGSTWTALQLPYQISAFGTGGGTVWAVGGASFYQGPSGTTWTPLTGATASDSLAGVFVAGANAAWAVGANGLVTHWDGNRWSAPSPPLVPTTTMLTAVWASSADDVYIGNGALGEPAGPTALYHFDGSNYEPVTLPQSPGGLQVVALGGSGADDVWLAATQYVTDTVTPVLDHFDGNTWSAITLPPDLYALNGIYCPGAGELWIVGLSASGRPLALHGNGSGAAFTFTESSLPEDLVGTATAIWGDGSALFVAVVSADVGPTTGVVLIGDGDSWQEEPLPTVLPTRLSGTGPDDLWAIGDWNDGAPHLAHRDASGWTLVPLPFTAATTDERQTPLEAIWAVSAHEAYFAESGSIWRWDGSSWSLDADLAANPLQAIGGVGGNVFAVGWGGMILRRADL